MRAELENLVKAIENQTACHTERMKTELKSTFEEIRKILETDNPKSSDDLQSFMKSELNELRKKCKNATRCSCGENNQKMVLMLKSEFGKISDILSGSKNYRTIRTVLTVSHGAVGKSKTTTSSRNTELNI